MTDRAGKPYIAVVALLFAAVFIAYIDRTNMSVAAIAMQAEFAWSETDKGKVLSSFFVGYLLLMIVSSVLTNRYGGKLVLGIAVLWWSVFTILTPPAAELSLAMLLAVRVALGLGEAAVFPAMINMVGRWVPLEHRSRATALCSSAISFGTLVALPVTGWLVRDFGWPSPFYAFGVVGIVWVAVWFYVVGDGSAPQAEIAQQKAPIPWGRLLSSKAIWAIIVAHFCHNWTLYVLLAWLPSYFSKTFGVALVSAGLLSTAPWIANFVMANVSGFVADRMIRSGRSVGFVRKLLQTLGLGGVALFLLQIPNAESATAATLLMCCATGTLGLCMGGFGPNAFDVAPKYADVVWGTSNTFATLPGIVGVYVTGWLLDRTGSYQMPFVLTAAIAAVGAIVYLALGSGKREID